MGGGSFKGGFFWFTSLRTSADSARFTSPQQSIRCKNKNPDTFATFFRLGTPFRPFKAKNEPEFRWLPAVLRLGLRSKRLTTIPNRKNLAIQTDFLFLDPKTASHQRSGQDRVVVMPRVGWGGHDAAGRMGQSQRRGQGGSVAKSRARWTGRNVVGEVDRPNSAKDPKGMESLSFSLVRRDALPH